MVPHRKPSCSQGDGALCKCTTRTTGASLADYPDRSQLQQIIAGITEGVILIEPDQAVTYANRAALAMHGVQDLDELGRTVDAYRRNFIVRERTSQAIAEGRSPIERVVAGEIS